MNICLLGIQTIWRKRSAHRAEIGRLNKRRSFSFCFFFFLKYFFILLSCFCFTSYIYIYKHESITDQRLACTPNSQLRIIPRHSLFGLHGPSEIYSSDCLHCFKLFALGYFRQRSSYPPKNGLLENYAARREIIPRRSTEAQLI